MRFLHHTKKVVSKTKYHLIINHTRKIEHNVERPYFLSLVSFNVVTDTVIVSIDTIESSPMYTTIMKRPNELLKRYLGRSPKQGTISI